MTRSNRSVVGLLLVLLPGMISGMMLILLMLPCRIHGFSSSVLPSSLNRHFRNNGSFSFPNQFDHGDRVHFGINSRRKSRTFPPSVWKIPRGGSRSTTTSTSLEAAKNASASAIQKAWDHPVVQAVSTWLVTLWSIIYQEIQALSTKQRWIMAGVFLVGLQMGRSLSSLTWQRFKDAVDIPTKFLGPTAPCLKGRAVSVSDGDTLRFYHRPTIFHKSTFDRKTQKLSEHTLPIRICTIDTPETAKFGKSGQPFGEEAKTKLQDLIENKMILVRLLSKDQYGRAVGQVYAPSRIPLLLWGQRRRGVDEIMLQAGLAEVYQGMGAVYGTKGKDQYLQLEQVARQAKKGIWSQSQRESAAEYKKRTK